MFEPSDKPRVYALPPGVDFSKALIEGLHQRWPENDPLSPPRTEIYVNTRRSARKLRDLFDAGPAMLLPAIRTLDAFGKDIATKPAVAPLRKRLEIARLVQALIAQSPDLAPHTAAFDLAESLVTLFDEAAGEGVDPTDILSLDLTDQSGHWARAQQFLSLVHSYFQTSGPGQDEQLRQATIAQITDWQVQPPQHPVIIAGSTGSRGTTHLMMEAVARLPQGAIVLPGFDFDMPDSAWESLAREGTGEDHPQYRALALMQSLGLTRQDILPWSETPVPAAARNKLLSLALRPAPVTDQWRTDQTPAEEITAACEKVTLLEAQDGRTEAGAIALGMRAALEQGKTIALVSPDRQLTRRVSMALSRWGIEPDDSAGRPLHLSAPGRLLRQIASLFGRQADASDLLAILKHPLVATGAGNRGTHLLHTRDLELMIRSKGMPFPDAGDLASFAEKMKTDTAQHWGNWIVGTLSELEDLNEARISTFTETLITRCETFCAGPDGETSGELWENTAGQEARKIMDHLAEISDAGGTHSAREFGALLLSLLQAGELRSAVTPNSNVMIWGTLEARVQSADIVILGGLNEGIWPGQPAPDPWLNRQMRKDLGLLLPERRTGLAAHDFQQAAGADEIWLTRSIRDASAETVPSRWLNRLMNLLSGLPDKGGPEALKGMITRGAGWAAMLKEWDRALPEVDPAPRPSPRPPVEQRPKQLSVTAIQKLIRDPYAIYAQYILNLRPLRPLQQSADAPLRGTVVHDIMEAFIRKNDLSENAFIETIDEILPTAAPWPAVQRIWRAKLLRVMPWFLQSEARRQQSATPTEFEENGKITLQNPEFTLICRTDRIDQTDDGRVYIYDYKTGAPPSKDQQKYFDKQLPLTAAIAERGAFKTLGLAQVAEAAYIGLGSKPAVVPAPLEEPTTDEIWDQFCELIDTWMQPQRGYLSRRAIEGQRFDGDFDHLARFGEWDTTSAPVEEDLQ
ncbi:double-strand break repair protein AddB [Thalassobius sp. I31.1]|uniref:double-strand break repair protein AddB n=1 Tax=Thalassobius sp. I31.1 TaxID=2109912 RepID=UPI000D19E75A|nr:double-strand break repair protein AddB [Thalassobius sp. I31.1]